MSSEVVLGELVKKSMGELERAILATQDGVFLGASNPSDIDDIVAALGAAVVAGVGDAFRQYFSTGVKDVLVELDDHRILLMRDVGGVILCLVSKPKPNLGLIYYLLDKYTDKVRASVKTG
ncbi:MAG: roadblock/LC7 domain-containing protein [Thermofilaceae archaeon]|nr:roadblock/LC7 domain-containing protein [Thermofilaceae archaeon]MCX8180847.1 roadblock/LC7 domain-containing protein [Thermofilaceae archaeon]MDW8003411.1 roadblock/LC7 domain-containing protein [Thermofilaceae archaeon]